MPTPAPLLSVFAYETDLWPCLIRQGLQTGGKEVGRKLQCLCSTSTLLSIVLFALPVWLRVLGAIKVQRLR